MIDWFRSALDVSGCSFKAWDIQCWSKSVAIDWWSSRIDSMRWINIKADSIWLCWQRFFVANKVRSCLIWYRSIASNQCVISINQWHGSYVIDWHRQTLHSLLKNWPVFSSKFQLQTVQFLSNGSWVWRNIATDQMLINIWRRWSTSDIDRHLTRCHHTCCFSRQFKILKLSW